MQMYYEGEINKYLLQIIVILFDSISITMFTLPKALENIKG